jgi:putative ABC transport system permease protein
MFDLDKWQEILSTIGRNRLRTALTGFSVAWGIFMLVLLLGAGAGLRNGVAHEFRDDAVNSIWVRPGQTSLPHRGLKPGRRIQFTNHDHAEVERTIAGVEHISSRFYLSDTATVSHGSAYGDFDVRAVHPDHVYLENTIVTAGRFINDLDVREGRKSASIGVPVQQALFQSGSPIGREIEINGIAFKVVGLFEDVGGEGERRRVYIPISTAQRTFNGANRIHQFMLTTGRASLSESQAMAGAIRQQLAARHDFALEDPGAVFVDNLNEDFQRFMGLMDAIRRFVWVVGIGTILAGVVGVSNIMMIVVRERTKEIGVRKALGASPGSIVGLILQESVLITAVAGYVGLVLGVAALELLAGLLPDDGFIRAPAVDLRVALQATVLLVLAGALAGWFPARRAARVRPIQALRDE